jgi:hypothetical protein
LAEAAYSAMLLASLIAFSAERGAAACENVETPGLKACPDATIMFDFGIHVQRSVD